MRVFKWRSSPVHVNSSVLRVQKGTFNGIQGRVLLAGGFLEGLQRVVSGRRELRKEGGQVEVE